jgi:hypothetical protein
MGCTSFLFLYLEGENCILNRKIVIKNDFLSFALLFRLINLVILPIYNILYCN